MAATAADHWIDSRYHRRMLGTTWGISYEVWGLFFELGVAVGTVGLAIATLSVARETKELARSTRQEVMAQSRPVVVASACELNPGFLRMTVRNVGAGPALNTRLETPEAGASQPTWEQGVVVSTSDRFEQLSLIADRHWAIDLEKDRSFDVVVSYDDLAGQHHFTKMTVHQVPRPTQDLTHDPSNNLPLLGVPIEEQTPLGTQRGTTIAYAGIFESTMNERS